MDIPNEPAEEWLKELKPFQREQLGLMLQSLSPMQAAEQWLAAQGAENIERFGGTPEQRKLFYNAFLAEMRKFLCGDPTYADLRKRLEGPGHVTRQVIISTIGIGISHTLGIIPALASPAVVMVLIAVGQMGVKAWCESTKGDSASE